MFYRKQFQNGQGFGQRGGGYGPGYNPQGNNQGYSNGYNGQMKKKHSGSKKGVDKKGRPWVNGWNYSRRNGLVKIFAHPYKGTKKHTSKAGKVWHNWIAQIQVGLNKPTITTCLYSPDTYKVIIADLGFVLNPNAPNHGYCGRFYQSKR